MLNIRLATCEDLPAIMDIYHFAQQEMRRQGNPHQWGDWYPKTALVEEDIARQRSYVFVDEQGVCGVFVFIIGADPTYARIDDGAWFNDEPYGTIHRIAGNGRCTGLLQRAVAYCLERIANLRIDTHRDNSKMLHLIQKCGFAFCGRIYTYDGSPRQAFQLCRELPR